jgi:cytochrome c biogenesis protein CcmG/thiol:disulfide interchange protein DsbE
MTSTLGLRLFKLLVLVGAPVLGIVYSCQFVGQQRPDALVPFKTFKAPATTLVRGVEKSAAPLEWKAPITVVNFWATWCPPCLEEFPSMIELQRQLEDKGVELVFISVDDEWQKVERFLADNAIDVRADRMYWDPAKNAAQVWGSDKFPETYVVRKDAWVVEKIVGVQRWTRPAVIEYFTELAQETRREVAGIGTTLWELLLPSAAAQGDIPLIHEDDKKTLETLKKNIETSSKNLVQAEAALKSERRSLEELEVLKKKREKEVADARKQRSELETKRADLDKLAKKNTSSLDTEKRERKTVEQQIKDSQKAIERLEKELESEKVRLVEIQKTLATRVQNAESLEKAKESLDEDTGKLDERLKGSRDLVKEKESALNESERDVSKRRSAVSDLESKVKSFEKTVEQQKKKLLDFENLLKK